jgi:hypothetical protein
MRETAFLVTRRTGEAEATAASQTATMVRNRQKANTARAMPMTVREPRKGCLQVLRQMSLNMMETVCL